MATTTYKNRVYDFYECEYEKDTSPTPGQDIVVVLEPHADSECAANDITSKRTRVYVNGERREVSAVVAATKTITITGAALVATDVTEVYYAATTGTTGIAANGKLARPLIQTAQSYRVTGDVIKRAGCGTKMQKTIVLSAGGELMLGIDKQDHAAISAFALAQENDVWLMAVISDTSSGTNKETVLNEVVVVGYGEGVAAAESVQGIEQEMLSLAFTPPAAFDTT